MSRLRLVEAAFPGRPAFDTAVSRALLLEVAEARADACLRLYRPDDVLAFSVLDRTAAGFREAVREARAEGFAPVLRLAGGRAAVFHRETLAFAWSRPVDDPRRGIEERYREIGEILAAALRALGVEARVGEVPGEYCPGRYSVNAGGRVKLAGVGQRVVRGAAHVGGVIVVDDAPRARRVLMPVYAALGLPLDSATVGCVADEAPGTTLADVADALRVEWARRYDVEGRGIDLATLARAETLAPAHDVA